MAAKVSKVPCPVLPCQGTSQAPACEGQDAHTRSPDLEAIPTSERKGTLMQSRINRAVALLASGQPIYYDGDHTGHHLTYEQGREDANTWADYINVGMEHGAFDMTGLGMYMQGLVDGGPNDQRPPHPDGDRRSSGRWIERIRYSQQRLAVQADSRPRRPRYPALPGGIQPTPCAPLWSLAAIRSMPSASVAVCGLAGAGAVRSPRRRPYGRKPGGIPRPRRPVALTRAASYSWV